MLSLLIILPLLVVFMLNIFYRLLKGNAVFRITTGLFLLQLVIIITHNPVLGKPQIDYFSHVFRANLAMDSLSFVVLICISLVCLASLFVAKYSLTDKNQRFNFVNLLIISSIGMNGIATIRDIFSLYVFLEITAVTSFVLIAFRRGRFALEGAFKYLILSSLATILLLFSIALLLFICGNTSFPAVKDAIFHSEQSPIVVFAVALFICGLFIKGGIVPFHAWLPDAYAAAPYPVSVLLAGIVTKVCGIYTLIRLVVSVFGFAVGVNSIILIAGAVSLVSAGIAALGQGDLRRMLAYSSISQMGFILLGLGSGTELGIIGAAFHFFNHAVFKTLLFVNSAAIGLRTGTTKIEELEGLSYKMPVTGLTSVIAFLSAGGLPPLAGFWSKLIIIVALWSSGRYAYAVIAGLSSVITLAYFLLMQRKIFFSKAKQGLEYVTEVNLGFSVLSILLAAIAIGAGVLFPYVYNLLFRPVGAIFYL